MAATRSVPECSASETSPRLPLAMPAPSLSAASAAAATMETSAVRRCGVIAGNYKLPRRACSRSIDSKSALKLPSPNVVAPWRSITSKKSVGRSCAVFVKIWSR